MLTKKVSLLSCLMITIFLISGCTTTANYQNTVGEEQQKAANSQQNDIGQQHQELTIDDIKLSFTDREVVNLTRYGQYALVETHKDTLANSFYWFNLKTGDKDILPTGPNYAKLEKIVNEDNIYFTADGRNHINGYRAFPFYIYAHRFRDDPDSEFDFRRSNQLRYLNLDEKVTFGKVGPASMADVKVTFDGIAVLFKPAKGHEADFFADYTGIPTTKTFQKNAASFVITFEHTGLASELKQSYTGNDRNRYLKGYEIVQGQDYTSMVVTLNESVKSYSVTTEHLIDDDLPIVRFHFSEKKAGYGPAAIIPFSY